MKRRTFLTMSATLPIAATATSQSMQPFRIGLITDVQYADAEPWGERHYRASVPKLKAAAADLSGRKLPFSVHLGDVIDRDFTSYGKILPVFGDLGHPVRHLLGNHDFVDNDPANDKLPGLLGMPANYYAFDAQGFRFIMLDTNDLSTYAHPLESEAHKRAVAALEELKKQDVPNAKPWNGGLSAKQLDWLDRELLRCDEKKTPAIVCGHHPLAPVEMHTAWNHNEILAVLTRHPSTKAYLSGHNHAGADEFRDGLPCITFKSLLHEPDVTAYSILTFSADAIEVEGFGREISRRIPLRVSDFQ